MSVTTDALTRVQNAFGDDRRPIPPEIYPGNVPTRVPQAFQQVQAEIEQLLLDGMPVPADVAAPIIEARRELDLGNTRMEVFNAARRAVIASRAETQRVNVDAGFAQIEAELIRVFDDVRAIAPQLRGVRDAEDAIAEGATDEWTALGQLCETYGDLRNEQRKRFTQLGETEAGAQGRLPRFGYFRNYLDVFPHWLAARREAYSASREPSEADELDTAVYEWLAAGASKADRSQDPNDSWSQTWWPNQGTKQAFLLRLTEHAIPWAPTPDTIEDLQGLTSIAIRPLRSRGDAVGAADALHAISQITGQASPVAKPTATAADNRPLAARLQAGYDNARDRNRGRD